MSKSLQLLIVRNNQSQSEFIITEFQIAGYRTDVTTVDSMSALESNLRTQNYDVVISDAEESALDTLQVVKLCKKIQPTTCFLIVADSVGEEKVAELMRAGANDFISIGNLSKLVPAYQRELNSKSNLQTTKGETPINASKSKSVDILESMGDGYIELDKNFQILRVNKNQELISGLPRSKTVGKNHWDIWPRNATPEIWDCYHKVINEKVPDRIEFFNKQMNIWLAVDAFPTPTNGIAAFFRDITDKKRAVIDYEQSVDVSPAILWITDKTGSCTY